jgi:hypothetical protein
VLIGLWGASVGIGRAEPETPSPGPVTTSTDDELVDMVLDAIEQNQGSTATPAPDPPD